MTTPDANATSPQPTPPGHRRVRPVGVPMVLARAVFGALCGALIWVGAMGTAQAQGAGIYSCVDAQGKRHTSDRPIPECLDREQRLLNRDGSERRTLPPRMNAEERALAEERKRLQEQAAAAQKDAVRRDRNLMMRFPDEPAHTKAREAALDDLRRAIVVSERRLKDLEEERKPLVAETEFYRAASCPSSSSPSSRPTTPSSRLSATSSRTSRPSWCGSTPCMTPSWPASSACGMARRRARPTDPALAAHRSNDTSAE